MDMGFTYKKIIIGGILILHIELYFHIILQLTEVESYLSAKLNHLLGG